jgi:hypothetical protein
MQKVQEAGASGLTGAAAIQQIVGGYGWGFERPLDPTKEVTDAKNAYDRWAQQLQSSVPGYVPPTITDKPPGQTQPGQLPIPGNPTTKPSTPGQATTGAKFSLHLFDLPSGPVNLTLPWDFSGILMFLAAIFAIIIGAILWKPSRDAATNVAVMAAE